MMRAYLLLQVLEERATTQFPLLEAAFRKVDSATADVVSSIFKDEERHLKYCEAIARKYAPDEATHAAELAHMRDVEARAFAAHGRANMAHVLERGYLGPGAAKRIFWSCMGALAGALRTSAPTRYWGQAPAAA